MQQQDDPDDSAVDRLLWDLLERFPEPVLGRAQGRFAEDVLRRIRLEVASQTDVGLRGWLRQSWKMVTGLTAGAAAVALLTTGALLQQDESSSALVSVNESPDLSALIASVPDNDGAVLGDMDTALDDNDIWLGSDSY